MTQKQQQQLVALKLMHDDKKPITPKTFFIKKQLKGQKILKVYEHKTGLFNEEKI
jgi:hypothetical protein